MMPPVREKLYEDGDVCFLCDHLFNRTTAAMHLEIAPGAWSPSKFKRYRSIFEDKIMPVLKDKKYKQVYATPLENDIKAHKLIAMFGFEKFATKPGFVLMKREI
jgi:hypothetical protein